eukprot:41179_1
MLREADFLKTELDAPLLQQNHSYLEVAADAAWEKTRIWVKLLLNRTPTDDEKKQQSITVHDTNDKQSQNYGLKLITKPDQIILEDSERVFITEKRRQLIITLLHSLQDVFTNYDQNMSSVSGILLLFFPPETVFSMVVMLERSPTYSMEYYWRSEVNQVIDSYVLYGIIERMNHPLFNHLTKMNVALYKFVRIWFAELAVEVMPIEHLIEMWTQYFRQGIPYLFKFAVSLLQNLSPLLLEIRSQSELDKVLRMQRKTIAKYSKVILVTQPIHTDHDKVSLFFIQVLSDTNSYNLVDHLHFHKEREYFFNEYLCKRFLNAAQNGTYVRYEIKHCQNESCKDGNSVGLYCEERKMHMCDKCNENSSKCVENDVINT